jgi:hypothetical protein
MKKLILGMVIAFVPSLVIAQPSPGNRLAYLDEVDPYYPHAKFPKLITPQWIGEPGVDAVVILAIDDMRDPKRYEAFLRPILRRLKEIDGRAPVSIMTNQVDPKDPQLQTWLKEGLSLECHTLDHPCPFFKDGFAKAKATYDKCVDLMNEIPGNKPVAFRMPCCDSLNTPSPRFFAEIFNKVTDNGKFLAIDSSVFNVFTADDPELPRDLVLMPDGTDRFRKYLPKDRSFVNTIENYPYPYVIGRLCWQFPCMTPSDWQAQHLQKPNNPLTVKDWQAALDCTVIKKGVMAMVFHPHGWIKNDQLVELVDYADKKYGKRVKFLNFREALERLDRDHLLDKPLRHPEVGQDNGCRILDLNKDGFLDVVGGGAASATTRIWIPDDKKWNTTPKGFNFSAFFNGAKRSVVSVVYEAQFADLGNKSAVSVMFGNMFFTHDGGAWVEEKAFTKGLLYEDIVGGLSTVYSPAGGDTGLRLRDIDGDGFPELIATVGNLNNPVVLAWSKDKRTWTKLPFTLPKGAIVLEGLRFLDLDGDGKLDIIFSNENEYGVYLFKDMKEGWSRKVITGKAGEPGALPLISNKGENMGFFVHSGQLWWSNETTALLKDHVARVSINELLQKEKH